MESPSYYAIIPARVRYDNRLKANEKLLYGELTALAQKDGYAYPSNRYLANLYDVSTETISRWIGHMKNLGYLSVETNKKPNGEINFRRITPLMNSLPIDEKVNTPMTKKSIPHDEKVNTPLDENVNIIIQEDNNTSGTGSAKPKNTFTPPTVEEVAAYCVSRQNKIDAVRFVDFYAAKGWYIGKNKMKDWKAAVRTWEHGSKTEPKKQEVNWLE